jgi:hypothetical protein
MKGMRSRTAWRHPNNAAIYRMIENPVYGGAYAYGRTGVTAGYGAVNVKIGRRRAVIGWR